MQLFYYNIGQFSCNSPHSFIHLSILRVVSCNVDKILIIVLLLLLRKYVTEFLKDVFKAEARTKVQLISILCGDDDNGQLKDIKYVGDQLL